MNHVDMSAPPTHFHERPSGRRRAICLYVCACASVIIASAILCLATAKGCSRRSKEEGAGDEDDVYESSQTVREGLVQELFSGE